MIYEYVSLICGMLKILIYKFVYTKRISFKTLPKMNKSFNIAIKKNSKLIIGKNLRMRNNVSFRIYNNGKINIGDNCFFNDGCSINCQEKIRIGDNVICGQNVMFFDHDHDYKNNMNKFVTNKIMIGNNVWIGANSIILKGVIIGDDVVIAAGSIVKENIPSNCMFYQEKKSKRKIYKEDNKNE